jgi:hypothetical protein
MHKTPRISRIQRGPAIALIAFSIQACRTTPQAEGIADTGSSADSGLKSSPADSCDMKKKSGSWRFDRTRAIEVRLVESEKVIRGFKSRLDSPDKNRRALTDLRCDAKIYFDQLATEDPEVSGMVRSHSKAIFERLSLEIDRKEMIID